MIKLDSLSRWSHLPKGDILTLTGDTERRIRLNVNCPKRITLYVMNEYGELQFLASPDGRDVIDFAAGGNVKITTEDDDVYFYTAENEPTFSIFPDAETYTRIAERAARNPDLEHLMYLQQINMDRRFAQMQGQFETRVSEAYEAGTRVANTDNQGAAPAQNDAGQPQSNADASAPTAGAGQAPIVQGVTSATDGQSAGFAPVPDGTSGQ